MNRMIVKGAAACVVVVAFAAAGCQQGGGGSGGRRDTGGSTAVGAGKAVPSNATRISENAHGRLVHRALRPGTIWVEDATTKQVIYSGQVRGDSNIVVDAKANALTVNNQQVTGAPRLNPDHRYRLYFRR